MADWNASMTQTFEFYEVDPGTWRDKSRLTSIISCKINRDLDSNLIETASIECTELMGECYIRVYLMTVQNGIREKHSLGTFLVQTPSSSFDGKIKKITMDAYSPLLELSDKKPSIGFTVMKNENIMKRVCPLTNENMRAPVIEVAGGNEIMSSDFTAEPDESWLDYLSALMANAKYYFMLDEMGRVLFSPKQDTASLQPKWTYTDDNSSILYPDISEEYDLFGIPNVVEVVYSGTNASGEAVNIYSRIENNDPESLTSIVNRGREVLYRETNPSISGIPDQIYLDMYASQVLKDLNVVEHTITYTHGYCPVKIGDCVRLNYERAGVTDVKAKVISQDIECSSGCKVTETAIYTSNLWEME